MVFGLGSLLAAFIVVAVARRLRSGPYAKFIAGLLTIHTFSSAGLFVGLSEPWAPFVYLQTVTMLHFLFLVRAKMRPWWWRTLISIPGHFFVGATVLGIPFAIAGALGVRSLWLAIPLGLAFVGVLQAFLGRRAEVHIDIRPERDAVEGLRRHKTGDSGAKRKLRIVQITDPHLGPWMSVGQLKRVCARAVAREPDIIVLTGDFLTMESHDELEGLSEALSPLLKMPGKVFACLGNHDYEALDVVQQGLHSAGVKLLVDAEELIETPAGPVQIVGFDFVWRERQEHMARVVDKLPRRQGALRLLLLHDPGAFNHLPQDEGDLVLSGHTHGGQLGLVSLGLSWTVLALIPTLPDHGLWARGKDRLYVHRGTGHYGFPLRLGVPREESLLVAHMG